MNPRDSKQIGRLRAAMDHARRRLSPFRERRYELIKSFAGPRYGRDEDAAVVAQPINLIGMFVAVMTRQMAARSPQVMVGTPHRDLGPRANDLELAMNATLRRIKFGRTLRAAVLDAFFCQGIVKVGFYESGGVELNGLQFQGAHPFAEVVDFDDFIVDIEARSWDRVEFVGDRYRVGYEAVMESSLYDSKAKEKLQPTARESDGDGDDRVSDLSLGDGPIRDEYRDHVELWDLWLPSEQLIVTLPVDGDSMPLRVVEWNGPHRGPYFRLAYADVPNNIMPKGPADDLLDLHLLVNSAYRKLADQAKREKTILGVMAEAAEDGEATIKASDGGVISLKHVGKMQEFHFGGVNQLTMAFAMEAMQRFSYLAGNLDVLGGLGPQSETVGQEQLLSSSASKQVQDMQDRTVEFTQEVCEAIAQLLWTDPLIQLPLSRRVEVAGIELEQPFVWGPEHRVGDFLNYNVRINPYSLREKSPAQNLQTILTFMQQVVAPLAPIMQQQGASINVEGLARMFAKYADMPDLERIVEFTGPPTAERSEPIGQEPSKPSFSKRVYERVNRPGASHRGQQDAMMQLLMGSRLQAPQRGQLNQPTG